MLARLRKGSELQVEQVSRHLRRFAVQMLPHLIVP